MQSQYIGTKYRKCNFSTHQKDKKKKSFFQEKFNLEIFQVDCNWKFGSGVGRSAKTLWFVIFTGKSEGIYFVGFDTPPSYSHAMPCLQTRTQWLYTSFLLVNILAVCSERLVLMCMTGNGKHVQIFGDHEMTWGAGMLVLTKVVAECVFIPF